jgi:hypothetical protein
MDFDTFLIEMRLKNNIVSELGIVTYKVLILLQFFLGYKLNGWTINVTLVTKYRTIAAKCHNRR